MSRTPDLAGTSCFFPGVDKCRFYSNIVIEIDNHYQSLSLVSV